MLFDLPESAMRETFLAGTGPGGQNANKVATTVQLHLDLGALDLSAHALRKLKVLAGSKLTTNNEIVITVRQNRTREANRAAAREQLRELIAASMRRDTPRRKTRPSRAAKAKRIDAKKQRGAMKQLRRKPTID